MMNPNAPTDLPPALANLLAPGGTTAMSAQPGGIGSAAMAPQMPSFQAGGMVTPGMGGMGIMGSAGAMGAPGLAPPGAAQQTLRPEQIIPEAQRFVQQNPQQVQQMLGELQRLLQTGELTREELNMVIQMARSAAQNPALYPQLRRIAIQRGVADPSEISEQFDPGLVFILVLMGEAMQMGTGSPGRSEQSGVMPSFKQGGMLPGKEKGRPVVAQLHEGEYVIPAHVVKAKGTEFFDRMLENYTKDGKLKKKQGMNESEDNSENYSED